MWEPCAGDMRVVHMMKERGHVVLHATFRPARTSSITSKP